MVTCNLPFKKADPSALGYKYIAEKREDLFWKFVCNKLPEKGVWLSEEFK